VPTLHQPDPLQRALKEMQAQREMEERIAMVLRQALTSPHTTTRYFMNACGLVKDGEQLVLHVGLPTGERLEVSLNPQVLATLVKAAADLQDDARAGKTETALAALDDPPAEALAA
jgi:hypothetical protein